MNARRRWLQRLLAAGGAVAVSPMAAASPAAGPVAGVPLQRGVNLTHWFEYDRSQAVSPGELQALRALGLDHVRLPLDPLACGWRVAEPGRRPFAADLRRVAEQVLQADLALVLDLHLEPGDKALIEDAEAGRQAIVQLWSGLAQDLRDLPPSRLAFELFNEPQFYGALAPAWPAFQRQMWQAVRAHAPGHTVLLTGHQGSSIEGLLRLRPLADAAAVYVFHHYAPYLFTHQGAHWMDTRYTTAGLHLDVRYPSAAQAGRPLRVSRAHPQAAAELQRYVAEDWDAQRQLRALAPAAAWARRHRVPVVCNEFGVLRAAAPPADRYQWITDVRRALESLGIGWTLWDYTHIFGITTASGLPASAAARQIEAEARVALGLAVSG